MRRPNIVYMHSHDTGRYVSPHGYASPTPRVQELAEGGVLFRNAFSISPTCSPARAALLTGMYPHEVGMMGLANRGFSLYDYGHHVVHTLGPAGYRTALAGVQHVAADWSVIGYDDVLPVRSRQAADVAPVAADYLARMARSDQPFFLDVGFNETHRDFPEIGSDDDPRYCQPPRPLPDTPETRAEMAAFHTSVRQLDAGIGTVLDALDSAGLADDTVVICTTDHGLPFPLMKGQLTVHGLEVMMIVRGPGGFTGGQVVDAMVSHLDVFPTICDVAGLAAPERLRGRSLTALARGEVDALHDCLYSEATFHVAYEPQRAIRTGRWNYVRRFDERTSRAAENADNGVSRAALERAGWGEQPRPAEMLFDTYFDPMETNNLVLEPHAQPILTELRGRLEVWMRETDDPLSHGPVVPPADARVDDPTPNPIGSQARIE